MVSLASTQLSVQQWLRPERIGQIAKVVNVLLILWVAWLLAQLSWLVVPGPETTDEPVATLASAPAKRQQARIDERQIASWHLFGEAGKEEPVKKPTPVNAPETRLKLTLSGLFASEDSRSARAIIGDPKGKEESYAIGDPLPGGAKLSEIYPDRIILERNGQFETLRLPKERASSVSSIGNRRADQVRPSGSAGQAAAFQKYRNEVRNNPASFMKYLRATPARQGGKFVGFRLQAGTQREAFKELGLEAGDIVTAINGIAIDSPAKGMKAMQALGEGAAVNVTLLRGGQEMSMSLQLPSSNE
jgi:general secretion pathway protein C